MAMNNFFLIRSRKGFTYIIVTTVIVVVLISIFFASSRYKYQDQESSQQIRIRAMNDFMKNLNNDMHRATYISTFRALLALEDHVATTGQYLTDMNASFREMFFYGNVINGTSSAIMLNSTFSDYLSKVQVLARSTGIILNVNVTQIHVSQSTPWAIDVYVLMNITAVDTKNTSSWNINKEYFTSVSIDNLRDPLYSKNTHNKVPNTVRQVNATLLVNGSNTTILQEHLLGSYYLASNHSPNFIMRFEGKADADINGIESVVDVTDLAAQGISTYDARVKVDYIYFNDIAVSNKICNVTSIPLNLHFVIPEDRKDLYQIENLTYLNTTCP
jgi:hypothetical protein